MLAKLDKPDMLEGGLGCKKHSTFPPTCMEGAGQEIVGLTATNSSQKKCKTIPWSHQLGGRILNIYSANNN